MQDLAAKRVTVYGLGHFGGGIAVCRWLVERGAVVTAVDRQPAEKLAGSIQQLQGLDITFHLGSEDEQDFTQADLVVASPAIAPVNEMLAAARAANVPITTEIKLFVERCPAPIAAVTGTKGKSTTTEMLGRMLRCRYTTWVGGNIGKSLLADLPKIKADHIVVLELSSYMLEHLRTLQWSPHVAVITMIAPDHLEWHGSFDDYLRAKRTIVEFQTEDDFVLASENSPAAVQIASASKGRRLLFGTIGRRALALQIAGEHNQLNAQAALAAAKVLGVSWDQAQAAVRDFTGLPHRLQIVAERDGVRWCNDSIATIPEAAVVALESFEAGRVLQIVGGSDKHLDMTPLCRALADRARVTLTIGQTGPALAAKVREMNPQATVIEAGDLPTAAAHARQLATPGDVILLSPGCASYGQFTNFQERGEMFARLANETV